MTVHYLEHGRTLCNKPGQPQDWEDGHFFITVHDRLDLRQDHDVIEDVNCDGCETELRARGLLKRKGSMVATKAFERDTPHSCWNKATDDEPVFILRAQDQLAIAAVRRWADLLEGRSHPNDTPRREKAAEARAWCNAADAWRLLHGGGKIPD